MTAFEHLRKKPAVTRKQEARYRRWVKYLSDSKLSEKQIHERASSLALQNKEPTDDP